MKKYLEMTSFNHSHLLTECPPPAVAGSVTGAQDATVNRTTTSLLSWALQCLLGEVVSYKKHKLIKWMHRVNQRC